MADKWIILQHTLLDGAIPYFSPDDAPGLEAYAPFVFDSEADAADELFDVCEDAEQPDGWIEACIVKPDLSIETQSTGFTRAAVFQSHGMTETKV